jgi:methyl acetate hydrolase
MLDDTDYIYALSDANLPGAAAMIVDRNGARYTKAVGYADWPGEQPMALGSLCMIASMTKAVTSVAAMQLVEQGRLKLDAPIGELLPELAAPRILTGFDADGNPQLRPAKTALTLRHLLTHTSGLSFGLASPELQRYLEMTGNTAQGTKASVTLPLLFEPGTAWAYGFSTDWVGFAIETASGLDLRNYFEHMILEPLGMVQTDFRRDWPETAAKVHRRDNKGHFTTLPGNTSSAEYYNGGAGLSSTAEDYGRFLRMFLRGGELDGKRVLLPETIAEMSRNQIGTLRGGAFGSAMPELTLPYDAMPGQHTGWGLGFAINPQRGPAGRSAGSLAWAGIFNSYYWIDPAAGVAGLFMTQLLPFADPGALSAFAALERMAYR